MKIAIIGKGNVGTHLCEALGKKADTVLVDSRSLDGLPSDADVALICVKDDAISDVALKLKGTKAVVAHTAGSVPMDVLGGISERYGVFYPLQTFTKGVELNYKEIPVFIEGNSPETFAILTDMAKMMTDRIYPGDSEKRKKLHLASVFACNFTNALVGVADRILEPEGIDFSVILPLLKQTVGKLEHLKPAEAQTGPAARGDTLVMNRHIGMLESEPRLQEIYRLLSEEIKVGKL